MEGYVCPLANEINLNLIIKKRCESHRFSIYKAMIVNIVNKEGKKNGFKWKNCSKYISVQMKICVERFVN